MPHSGVIVMYSLIEIYEGFLLQLLCSVVWFVDRLIMMAGEEKHHPANLVCTLHKI